MSWLAVLLCIALVAAIGRILFFQREGARFRRHISVIAWLVAVCLLSLVIDIVLGRFRDPPLAMSVLLLLFCLRIWLDRGNVARLFGTGV